MGDTIARGLANTAKTLANTAQAAANGKAALSQSINTQTLSVTNVVSPITLAVAPTTRNLFNKLTRTVGYYVNFSFGILSVSDPAGYYDASDYIPVLGGMSYHRITDSHIAYYDQDKTFISGTGTSGLTFVTPISCRYIRVSIPASTVDAEMIELGTTYTSYLAYAQSLNYASKDTADSLRISLPAIVPAVVGHELNIYLDNIICAGNINNFQFNVICTKGTQQNERWTYVPAGGDVGDIAMSIEIFREYVLVTTLTSTIRVSASTKGTGQNPKVLIIGDSTIADNTMINELATLFTTDADMDITFIGTKGTTPKFHEGISGWTISQFYTDASSPFVFSSAFNFATYLSTNVLNTPDIVIFNLGINDVSGYVTDATLTSATDTMLTRLDAMITNIKISNANMKFGICLTIPPSYNQDAFGKNYDSGIDKWRYNRNNRYWANRVMNYYASKTAQSIYLVPVNVNLDTVHNMQTETVAVNSRNTATVVRQSNGVHPATDGYEQIADLIYYWLKSMAT